LLGVNKETKSFTIQSLQ